MKRGCLVSFVVFTVLVLVSAGVLVYVVAKANAPTVERGAFVEIEIGGSIPENVSEASFFGADPLTMKDISDVLHWAADDSHVQGIVLKISPLAVGWGKLEEIRGQIEAARAKGKTVVAFVEQADDPEFYLASAAEKVFMPPMGFLGVDGINAQMEF